MGLPSGTADTLSERVALQFAARIEQRLLLPGTRLPSVREGARQQGVSPFTLVAAYDRLQALGLVEARPKRGFYVREPRSPKAAPRATPALASPFDTLTLMRSLMAGDDSPLGVGPAHGTLPSSFFDAALLRQALRQATVDDAVLLRYGEPEGDPLLRELLAQRLADLGIAAAPAQILCTTGATQALELVARTLAQPGDAVLVDEPGWPVEYARLVNAGLRLLPVPRNAKGPDLAVLAQLVQQHRPRLYVTVSVLHNPTGHSLTPAQAHELLRLTEAAGTLLVEDDTYAAFAPPHLPRLAALDGLRRTLYVSGFSKLLGAGLRVGFLAGPQALVERLAAAKLVGELSTPPVTERAIAHLLQRGGLRRHIERVNEKLETARQRCRRLAEQHGFAFSHAPAGLFGWLDCGVDSEALAHQLAGAGIRLAPERLFNADRRSGPHIRVNFAASQEPRFWRLLSEVRDRLRA